MERASSSFSAGSLGWHLSSEAHFWPCSASVRSPAEPMTCGTDPADSIWPPTVAADAATAAAVAAESS